VFREKMLKAFPAKQSAGPGAENQGSRMDEGYCA
jgi:hypothetical protein